MLIKTFKIPAKFGEQKVKLPVAAKILTVNFDYPNIRLDAEIPIDGKYKEKTFLVISPDDPGYDRTQFNNDYTYIGSTIITFDDNAPTRWVWWITHIYQKNA